MATSAAAIHSAVDRVSAISDENKRCIDTLVSEISKFKINPPPAQPPAVSPSPTAS
jgi:hypothetical protein